MPSCPHCKWYDDCLYFWKNDDDWDCDDFEMSRMTFRESDINDE